MRLILILILILHTLLVNGQSKKNILDAIKEKKLQYLVEHIELPFDLLAGSEIDQSGITDRALIKQKFQTLFALDYFKIFLHSKCVEKSGNRVVFIYRNVNKFGELESESSMSFKFTKSKQGRFLLKKIELDG